MAKRSSITIPSQHTKGITVRLGIDVINDIDTVVDNINSLLSSNLSRNQLIELMFNNARAEAKFDIDGVKMSFDELLYFGENNKENRDSEK